MMGPGPTTVLVAGATGFVGRYLHPALVEAGYRVRCGTRHPDRIVGRHPGQSWVRFDPSVPSTVFAALAGCDAAVYLVHSSDGCAERALRAASTMADAAERSGVRRIVYLGIGGPLDHPSRHVANSRHVGAVLRSAGTSTVELRATMILGAGGLGWRMLRALAARPRLRTPPAWLDNYCWPVDIEDVVHAQLAALECAGSSSASYDLPGPDRVTHRELVEHLRRRLRHLTIRGGSDGDGRTTDAVRPVRSTELDRACAVAENLCHDLDPTGEIGWPLFDHEPLDFEEAIDLVLEDERFASIPSPPRRARLRALARPFRHSSVA